jgi:RNA-dependent RNA polymerase
LLDASDLFRLRQQINSISATKGQDFTIELLTRFAQRLEHDRLNLFGSSGFATDASALLHHLHTQLLSTIYVPLLDPTDPSIFPCYHAVQTPSRVLVYRPVSEQSNRIVRKYPSNGHFMRVSFRTEGGLNYRRDPELDFDKWLEERVGRALEEGMTLMGRRWDFLGYAVSLLREHRFVSSHSSSSSVSRS